MRGIDWKKRGRLITAIFFATVAAFAFLCFKGSFPPSFLGGKVVCVVVGLPSAIIAAVCGYQYYKMRKAGAK